MQSLILTLDAAGIPRRWSTWQDAAVTISKGQMAWSLGDETPHFGGKSRLTGKTSVLAIPSIIAVRGKIKSGRVTPALTNRGLFLRDRHICAYCGDTFPERKLSRDHVIPTSRGGKDVWSNVVCSCISCNQKKAAKLLSECGMSLLYIPYVPHPAEALIMQNRRILADQMDFLKSALPAHSRLL